MQKMEGYWVLPRYQAHHRDLNFVWWTKGCMSWSSLKLSVTELVEISFISHNIWNHQENTKMKLKTKNMLLVHERLNLSNDNETWIQGDITQRSKSKVKEQNRMVQLKLTLLKIQCEKGEGWGKVTRHCRRNIGKGGRLIHYQVQWWTLQDLCQCRKVWKMWKGQRKLSWDLKSGDPVSQQVEGEESTMQAQSHNC